MPNDIDLKEHPSKFASKKKKKIIDKNKSNSNHNEI